MVDYVFVLMESQIFVFVFHSEEGSDSEVVAYVLMERKRVITGYL
ncbi:MAG TPA: hypothetical protein PK268_01705 [Enterococcus sp.]|nr:hypothetical protein [Enterococcus sp.]HPR80619.1 hypothetical protein [Enterococcus sp.]